MTVATKFVVEAKYRFTFQLVNTGYLFSGFVGYTALNVMLVTLASYITVSVGPKAAGSGIPECMGFLNGINLYECLSFSTLFTKVTRRCVRSSLQLTVHFVRCSGWCWGLQVAWSLASKAPAIA